MIRQSKFQRLTVPRFVIVLTFAAMMLFVSNAQAVLTPLVATLDQAEEVPAPILVPGASGFASMSYDDIIGELSWNISFSGLSGAATGIHFHGPAPAGINAGVQVNVGLISGYASPVIGSATITAAQASDLLAGLWYINIHTPLNPAGEIRGQVFLAPDSNPNPIPVPGSLALVLTGLVSLSGFRRRRHSTVS